MLVTWTVLRARTSLSQPPWLPIGACWSTAGHSSPGSARPPASDGVWWSVVATWDEADSAGVGPIDQEEIDAWHVVLHPVSSHGTLVLADEARPFDSLTSGRRLEGPAALITVAGRSPDDGREREFFRRFMHVSRDIGGAPGHVASLVHSPVTDPEAGPVLTFSAWKDLDAGLDWAYARSKPHASAVRRQRSHGLVQTSGSLRCAVLSSRGTLGGLGDPLAGLRGRAVDVDLAHCAT
jgi:heme-degrading monooxygenase HmoA